MKKFLPLILLLSFAVACKDTPPEPEPTTEDITASVSEGNFSWTGTPERIAYHTDQGYQTCAATPSSVATSAGCTVTLTATRDAFAVYPASLVSGHSDNYGQSGASLDITLPAEYPLAKVSDGAVPCPLIAANAKGSGWNFKYLCGQLTVSVGDVPADASYLVLNFRGKKVCGDFSVPAPVSPGSSAISTSESNKEDRITVTGLAETTGLVINIPIPEGEYDALSITLYDSNGKALQTNTAAFHYTGMRGQVKEEERPTAAIPVFSVSNNTTVYFSRSNLQCKKTGSDWSEYEWSFMDHAWDVVETADVSVDYAKENAISLFGWGTSGYKDWPEGRYGKCSAPNSTSTTASDYGPVGGGHLRGEFSKGDWGSQVGNLDDGCITSSKWRTLSAEEWSYLFTKRKASVVPGANNARFAIVRVCDRPGWLLFPDSFVWVEDKMGPVPNAINRDCPYYDGVINYDQQQFEAISAAGAVFLPNNGWRSGTAVRLVNVDCNYWTTTGTNAQSANSILLKNGDNVTMRPGLVRNDGFGVRLVMDI